MRRVGERSGGGGRAAGGGGPQHSIAVAVRLRPPSTDQAVFVDASGTVDVGGRPFRVGTVVQGSDQMGAYEALAAPLVDSLMGGYSCTLLAYGQTGSGKTHTMFGPPGALTEASLAEAGGSVPADWGIFPRTVLELLQSGEGTLHASAVEVYDDKAYDLLADRAQLSVGTKRTGVVVGKGAGAPLVIGDHHRSVTGARAETVNGAHPSGCRCRHCWAARDAELKARLAKVRGGGAAPPPARGARAGGAGGARAGGSSAGSGGGGDQFATVGETMVAL